MARRWRMEAVQQNTSLEVQMSHSSGPRIHEALIYNIQYFNLQCQRCSDDFVKAVIFVVL